MVTGTLLAQTIMNGEFEGEPVTHEVGNIDPEAPLYLANDLPALAAKEQAKVRALEGDR